MRVFYFIFILGILFLPCLALAQEGNVTEDVSSLQTVLTNLKDSVQKMSVDNDQLASHDNAIKSQVAALQAQLGQLEDQGGLLDQKINRLHDRNPARARQITRLEEENSGLDTQHQKTQDNIRSLRQSLNTGYQEDQRLLAELNGTDALSMSPSRSRLEAHRQKEKLQLIKMIYDSQQRQAALQNAILKLQQSTRSQPAVPGTLARQTKLPAPTVADQQDEAQLRQLQEELKSLEHNYAELKNLSQEMGQKAKSIEMTVSQHVEEQKLLGSLHDLIQQGEALKLELDGLRAQMIDLDKRKSTMEGMIQHSR